MKLQSLNRKLHYWLAIVVALPVLIVIVTGLLLGMVEGFTKVVYAPASSTVIFLIMVIVLLVKPAGLFGKES